MAYSSERVSRDFAFLPELPELGRTGPSQWLAEIPGEEKASLDYLLTIYLVFLPLQGSFGQWQ